MVCLWWDFMVDTLLYISGRILRLIYAIVPLQNDYKVDLHHGSSVEKLIDQKSSLLYISGFSLSLSRLVTTDIFTPAAATYIRFFFKVTGI